MMWFGGTGHLGERRQQQQQRGASKGLSSLVFFLGLQTILSDIKITWKGIQPGLI